jgi:hypothetical protein
MTPAERAAAIVAMIGNVANRPDIRDVQEQQVQAILKLCKAEREGAMVEVARLKRILTQELSENDELGTEYAYVVALKERVRELEVALEKIAAVDCCEVCKRRARAALARKA